MVVAEAASVVTTLKNAVDIVDKLRNSDRKEDLRFVASSLTEMLISARLAALALIEQKALLIDERSTLLERVKSLESEIRTLADFDLSSEKYERVQTAKGRFVFREMGKSGDNSPRPYLCPNCFSKKSISIMQLWDTEYQQYYCQACKSDLYF